MMNKKVRHSILLLACLFCYQTGFAQIQRATVQVDKDMIIIRVDQRSADYYDVMRYFQLNEDSLFKHGSIGAMEAEGWQLIFLSKRVTKIARPLQDGSSDMFPGHDAILLDIVQNSPETPGYPGFVDYGVNRFNKRTVLEQPDGGTLFYLPGNLHAQTVFLSGNFNDWSTGNTPMTKTDSGWIYSMPLVDGKYFYKFIVDGIWIHDNNNLLRESDGYHGFNSTYYKTNTIVYLAGNTQAKQVILTGSFNNWDEQELYMLKSDSGWYMPMYLREGTHTYKFIVDGNWILDPANPVARPDGAGNVNSVLSVGDTTFFFLGGHPEAKTVILSGNFNAWNTAELQMEKIPEGWSLPYVLGAGNYEYKFIVDGVWKTDPANPLSTISNGIENSIKVIQPNYIFTLKDFADARSVYITGSFNNWYEPGYRMTNVQGVWKLPLYLKPGKYTYKFIVDGNWITDPGNPLTEQNQYGTGNSVLWISSASLPEKH